MEKIKNEKSLIKQNSKIAIAVTMLAIPMLYSPSTIFAQQTINNPQQTLAKPNVESLFIKFTDIDGELSIVGSANNHMIYLTNKGELCWVDAKNGNFNFLPKSFKYEVMEGHKGWLKVFVLGADKNGNIMYKDALGNKFTLNPKNFDMTFVK